MPTAGPPLPRGLSRVGAPVGAPLGDAHLSPSSPVQVLALSPICSQAHHILRVS